MAPAPSTGPAPLRAEPGHPFRLVHYAHDASGWFPATIEGEGRFWLPRLVKDQKIPGLCGHRARRGPGDRHTAELADRKIAYREGTVIPGEAEYCVGLPCVSRSGKEGRVYVTPWETPAPRAPGQSLRFRLDRQGWYRWLRDLVAEGVVEPPPEGLLDATKARLAARVLRRRSLQTADPAVRDEYAQEAQEEVEGAEEAVVPGEEPKKTTSKKTTSKKATSKKATTGGGSG